MKWLDSDSVRLMLVGIASVIVFGIGHTKADFTFGEPTNMGPTVNTSYDEVMPSISADGLSLYFCDGAPNPTPGGYGGGDLWVTTKQTSERIPEGYWGEPQNLGPTVNTSFGDQAPCISADGLSLYFSSNRTGGYGNYDLWTSNRTTIMDDWSTPVNLGPIVNSSADEHFPSISADGLHLYFSSWQVARNGGHGGNDIWVATRETTNSSWQEPVNLGSIVNSSASDNTPTISSDGLLLCFTSTRSGGYGREDLWISRRATVSDPWESPVNLGSPINSSAYDALPNIVPDGSILYFSSNRLGGSGNWDLWQAPIIPIVDFNSDGMVDAVDMCIMVDHWGTDYSLCDIGPMPLGDGIVDVQDLIILVEHLFEEVPPIQ